MTSSNNTLSEWKLTGLILVGASFVICFMILCIFSYNSLQHRKQIDRSVAICALVSIIITLLWIAGDWFRILFAFGTKDDEKAYVKYQWLIITNLATYYIALLFLYISLALRAHFFSTHVLQRPLSRFEKRYLVTIVSTDAICIVFFIICIHNAEDPDHAFIFSDNQLSNSLTLIMTGVTVIVNDVLINIGLLYLMLSRLYKYILFLQQNYRNMDKQRNEAQEIITILSNNTSNNNNNNNSTNSNINEDYESADLKSNVNTLEHDNTNLTFSDSQSNNSNTINSQLKKINQKMDQNSKEQKDALNLITKLSIITIFCVIASQMFNIATLYTVYEFAITKHSTFWMDKHVITDQILCEIQAIVNCLVLYFMFIFSENAYFKIPCCGLLHECLKQCVTNWVVRRLVNLSSNGDRQPMLSTGNVTVNHKHGFENEDQDAYGSLCQSLEVSSQRSIN